jgi:hypothetical protein
MALLLTCKSISEDLLDLLYGSNVCFINLSRWPLFSYTLKTIGPANLQRIRDLAIITEPSLNPYAHKVGRYHSPPFLDWRL